MGRGAQTWKEKIEADTAYASQFPQFSNMFWSMEQEQRNCKHERVVSAHEILGDSSLIETTCSKCGLINPPSHKGQRVLWLCDCEFENANSRKDCKRCGTKRGERISEIYLNGERSEDLRQRFVDSLA